MTDVEQVRLEVGAGQPVADVTAVVHRPAQPRGAAVLLTHGAGNDLDAGGLVALADGLAGHGHLTVRANLPYREAGRSSPPLAERSAPGLSAIAASARATLAPRRAWVVGGKSYGGRVASLAVAGGLQAAGLLFYGYPLHAPGRSDRVRVDHWPAITVPSLFLEGTRDDFCDLDLLRQHLPSLGAPATLHVVEGGDHSLRVRAADSPTGRPRGDREVLGELAAVVAEWLATL